MAKLLEDPKVLAHVAKTSAAAIKAERARILEYIKTAGAPPSLTLTPKLLKEHKAYVKTLTSIVKAQ